MPLNSKFTIDEYFNKNISTIFQLWPIKNLLKLIKIISIKTNINKSKQSNLLNTIIILINTNKKINIKLIIIPLIIQQKLINKNNLLINLQDKDLIQFHQQTVYPNFIKKANKNLDPSFKVINQVN